MRYTIAWTDDHQRVLDEIERRLSGGFKSNRDLTAKAFLTLLKEGESPTAEEIVDYVYLNYAPMKGWIGFDRTKWIEYPRTLAPHLQSNSPEKILQH